MPILQQVHSLVTDDGRLRIDFQWHLDRFIQRIYLDDIEVGGSIEGGQQEPWPASPPIQQLLTQEIDGSTAILGVGAAGRSHWSISAELQEGAIEFDVACRCKGDARFLGSSYELVDAVVIHSDETVVEARDGRIAIQAATDQAGTHRWRYSMRVAAN